MAKKRLKVDRKKFEGVVQNLLQTKPMKREKVKVARKKPEKLFPREMKKFCSAIRACTIERYT